MPREKVPCGNLLFLSWVQELREQARERGSKLAEVYTKASHSLERCPVSYPRPRDLICLAGIGPKTVGILEVKWKKHCEENGLPLIESPDKRTVKGKSKVADTPESGSESDTTEFVPVQAKKRKTAKPKPYIPNRGSGGYGILLSLVLAIDQPSLNTQVFLTKSMVIRGAQLYSDSSYEHSEKGTCITAWNNMKTLVGKGYVYVTGNPHKYCLTEEGYEVACVIRALRPEFSHIEKHPFLHSPAIGMSGTAATVYHAPSQKVSPPPTQYPLSPPESNTAPEVRSRRVEGPAKFLFWYIDSTGSRTPSLMSAMVRLDPEEYVNIRKVEFRAAQRSHPFSGQLRLVDADPKLRDDSGKATLFGYILEDGAPPTCSRFDEDQTPEAVTSRLPASDRAKGRASGEYDDDWVEPLVTVKAAAIIPPSADSLSSLFSRTNSAPAGPSRGPSRETPAASLASEAATRRAAQAGFSGSSRSHSVGSDFALPSKRPAPRLSSHVPLRTPLDDPGDPNATAVIIPSFEPSEAIIFPAGSYDVVLVLDTREVESKTNRDKIADALDAKGVKVETRALRLGDMCWIARRRDGIGGEEDECVLDYVVERKRLDDLCSSIKDGRYLEQCFRLSNSCINHVFYIVEDWQVGKHIEYSAAQIMTAKSQIQVHNRFFLKETHQLSETIDFLATMSDVITSSHRGKDLSIVPTRFLSRSTYSALQTHLRKEVPAENFLTSFSAYQELNDKSASKTLREKFAGMLLCVKGMSAERVSAVLDVWDTPRGLWDALKERPGKPEAFHEKTHTRVREPEMLFADRVQGDGRRKIGDALSRELYRTFSGGELVS